MADNSKAAKVSTLSPGEVEDNSSIARGKVDHHNITDANSDVDVAAKYANMFTNGETYSIAEWVKLRWKLDLRLVPLLWFNVTLGAMDKVTTATASLYSFREDTGLSGDRYSWVGSAFYVRITLGDDGSDVTPC